VISYRTTYTAVATDWRWEIICTVEGRAKKTLL